MTATVRQAVGNEHFLNGVNVAMASMCAGQLFKEQKWFLGLLSMMVMGYWAKAEVTLTQKELA